MEDSRKSNFATLKATILTNSSASIWEIAIDEWEIIKSTEDDLLEATCICGKEGLKYLYTIKNSINNNILEPIGSSCIKKFGRDDLNEFIEINESLVKLLSAIQDKKEIEFSSEFFSRKIFRKIFDEGYFKPNRWNDFDGENDYDFLLKMFNKRDKNKITDRQEKKIAALWKAAIVPFLNQKIKEKNI